MTKKIAFGTKPVPQAAAPVSPDRWVAAREAEDSTKRLTIDIPASLHVRIKSQCALRGKKMADEIRELLESHFTGTAA